LHTALMQLARSQPELMDSPTASKSSCRGISSQSDGTPRWTVRRLTPTECERLMGLPDGWTVVEGWKTRSASTPTDTDAAEMPSSSPSQNGSG
jgi:site-specific DNA-cytosine methylase